MASIINIRNLGKHYNNAKNDALNSIDLDLSLGQIVGLFGSNGSGKTTLLDGISGILNNYSGDIYIDGNFSNEYTKSIISYCPSKVFLDPNKTVKQEISFFKDIYKDFDLSKMESILYFFNINKKNKIKKLSEMQKNKLQFGLCISRNAKIYLFDEPFAGLDDTSKEFLIKCIMTINTNDKLIIIATNFVKDIENICKTVIFLKNGHISRFGDRKQIVEEHDKTLNDLFEEENLCF